MKALRILIVPAILGLLTFLSISLGSVPKDAVATLPPAEDFTVSGTLLGDGNCVIYYTLNSKMVDEVTAIDCPPEGLPAEAAAKTTLREQAIALFPEYEETIASLKNGDL